MSPLIPPASRLGPRRGCIGLLLDGGRCLMIQRALHLRRGGAWCFPGGHVDPGENARHAVVREILEEVNLVVAPHHRFGAVRVEREYVLAVWGVRYVGGELRPNPAEVADVRWVPLQAVAGIVPGLASNASVSRMLSDHFATRASSWGSISRL